MSSTPENWTEVNEKPSPLRVQAWADSMDTGTGSAAAPASRSSTHRGGLSSPWPAMIRGGVCGTEVMKTYQGL